MRSGGESDSRVVGERSGGEVASGMCGGTSFSSKPEDVGLLHRGHGTCRELPPLCAVDVPTEPLMGSKVVTASMYSASVA